MRVLYLLRFWPTLSETFVAREAAMVRARGHDVQVARLSDRPDGALQSIGQDIPVLDVPRRPWRVAPQSTGSAWLGRHQRDKDVRRYRWLLRNRPDVDRIHCHFAGEAAEWACALRMDGGPPYTVMLHAHDLYVPRVSLRDVAHHAERVLVVSEDGALALAGLGIPAQVVRCGPDLDAIPPQTMPRGALHAVFVGRDIHKKGLDDLLAAWPDVRRRHPEAILTLVTNRVVSMPGVQCRGLLAPEDALAAMDAAQVVVLPARVSPSGNRDGVPLVLMEALALGRPVVTCPVGGIGELVDDDVGWLVPSGDRAALADTLANLDHATLAAKGAAGPGRLRARGFTLHDQVQGVLRAWGAAVPSPRTTRYDGP